MNIARHSFLEASCYRLAWFMKPMPREIVPTNYLVNALRTHSIKSE